MRWFLEDRSHLFNFSPCHPRTVFEEVGEGADVISINGREISLRAYCSQFNFKGSDQQVRVAQRDHMSRQSFCARSMCTQQLFVIFTLHSISLCIASSDMDPISAQKKVGVLSGGERNRLQLAKVSFGP